MDYEEISNAIRALTTEATIHAPYERNCREQFFRQILGDVAAAIASMIPIDFAERSRGTRDPTERSRGTRDPTERSSETRDPTTYTKIQSLNGYTSVIAKADVCGRKFYAEADIADDRYKAYVYEDRGDENSINAICRIAFANHCGSNAVMKIMCGVLSGISAHYGHGKRRRLNKRSRRTLTPDQELAATVARQMDDDELAQRMENA